MIMSNSVEILSEKCADEFSFRLCKYQPLATSLFCSAEYAFVGKLYDSWITIISRLAFFFRLDMICSCILSS
jgi:hypothetical protein